jgi:hypothetical protein
MKQADRRTVEVACEALSISYARAVDFRDYDAFVGLFAEDGQLDTGKLLQGREAIANAMSQRPDTLRSRHILTNIFTDVLSDIEARGISYLTLYRHIGPESLTADPIGFEGPAGIGHYEDRFVKTSAGWKFKQRKLHFAFRRF